MIESDLFSLAGKRALVTGGASGLGRMIAEGLLAAGAAVTITSRKAERCAEAAAALSKLGDCTALTADLSTPEAAEALAAQYRAHHNQLHLLVNNAGKTWGGPIDSFPDRAWAPVMAVNVQIPFKLVQAFLTELTNSGSPSDPTRVINIGSAAGAAVEPLEAYSYSASKAAMHHLSRQMAADLAARNITVNCLVPGFFPTAMTSHLREGESPDPQLGARIPLGRLGRPDDIAGATIFLASRAGAYVTGALLVVDGGLIGCR